jgi:non-heme chloroperoxidase
MEHFTGVEGVQLAAERAGDDRAPAVLFFHGGGQTRHAWGTAVAQLAAAGWQAWSIDMRGHGDSDWSPDGRYTIDRFAGDVAAVAAEFDRPSLVGASLGGISALTAVGEGLVPTANSLVLVDITPRFEPEGARRVHAFMSKGVDGFASLEDVADAIADYLPHRRRPRDLTGLNKNLRCGDDGRWYWHWDPRFLQLADEANEIRPLATEERLVEASGRVDVPTLLVRGALSDVVSDHGVDDLKQHIPHAEVAVVGGAGHMVAGDRNDAFNSTVIEFLGRHRP